LSGEKAIRLCDRSTGKRVRRLPGNTLAVSLAFSLDGRTLASADRIQDAPPPGGAKIRLWDVATGKQRRQLARPASGVESLLFSADGKTLVSVSARGPIRLWDVATGRELGFRPGHEGAVRPSPFPRTGGPWPPGASTGRFGSGSRARAN
jgi:WD40 repeat protein